MISLIQLTIKLLKKYFTILKVFRSLNAKINFSVELMNTEMNLT